LNREIDTYIFFYLFFEIHLKITSTMASKVWLVTGTSSGLGSEFVKAALGRGDKVIATARNVDNIAHLRELGAAVLQLDVTDPQAELDRKAIEAISVYGRIDVLVNNAGYTQFGTVEDTR
jgi:NAD(P)-dependent dehydrogenase (short-subunit alcohol dehydrogenase family)